MQEETGLNEEAICNRRKANGEDGGKAFRAAGGKWRKQGQYGSACWLPYKPKGKPHAAFEQWY